MGLQVVSLDYACSLGTLSEPFPWAPRVFHIFRQINRGQS